MANISSRTIARADPTDLGFINSRGRGAIEGFRGQRRRGRGRRKEKRERRDDEGIANRT